MKKAIDETKIAIFKGKEIRKTIYHNEWWFSVVDVIEVLTGTDRARKYWSDFLKKIVTEGYSELSDKIGQLKLISSDGKRYLTDCVNTETMFRLVQSIPSSKRTRVLYKLKGYPDDWIEKRMRGIAIREELTDEWQKRGVQEKNSHFVMLNLFQHPMLYQYGS